MDKINFYKILCSYTSEELNNFISNNAKIKIVNAVTFLSDEDRDKKLEEYKNKLHVGMVE